MTDTVAIEQSFERQPHTSVLLRALLASITTDHFTIEWLMNHVPKRSFGLIMLFLAMISLLPIISIVSRLLIMVLAVQIIMGYHSPVLPRWLVTRKLPSRYLVRLDRHAIPMLEHLEMVVRPRWPVLMKGTRQLVAFAAMILNGLSLIAPLPFANVPPAIVCALIALAYIEHDGLLLFIALLCLLILLMLIALIII